MIGQNDQPDCLVSVRWTEWQKINLLSEQELDTSALQVGAMSYCHPFPKNKQKNASQYLASLYYFIHLLKPLALDRLCIDTLIKHRLPC